MIIAIPLLQISKCMQKVLQKTAVVTSIAIRDTIPVNVLATGRLP